jgi:hypothetical protein
MMQGSAGKDELGRILESIQDAGAVPFSNFISRFLFRCSAKSSSLLRLLHPVTTLLVSLSLVSLFCLSLALIIFALGFDSCSGWLVQL